MKGRKGFALVTALLSLMLIAALAAGVFLTAMEETRIGAAATSKEQTRLAAESAIESTIGGWTGNPSDPIGLAGTRTSSVDGFGTPISVSVTRLDSTIYWIVAESRSVSSPPVATRRIGVVVRAQIAPDRSITIDRIRERWWSELF